MKVFTEHELKAARIAKQAKRQTLMAQTKNYKKVWLDEDYWLLLSKSRGVRLPPMYHPATEKTLKRWARKLGRMPFIEWYGCSPAKLIEKNPRVPLRAFVGQMLEP